MVRDGPDHRFEANIAGFGEQHGTHTDRQIPHAGGAFTEVRKFVCKACTGVDFQKDLRQIDTGEAGQEASRSLSKRGGSSSLSSPVSVRVSRPCTDSRRTAAFVGKFAAVR